MKPSEILDNAANIILRDGWHQGEYYKEIKYIPGESTAATTERDLEANRTAPCCQDGAISRAATGYAWMGGEVLRRERVRRDDTLDGRMRARDYMRQEVGPTSAIEWNDRDGRTKEEVVETLRAAADRARAAGE